ncbi:MAG: helix-turn-helix domain-containing protein [Coriobacteriales bacterium]
MAFDALLNGYIDCIGCTARELARVSGISASAISRYRSGERTPDPESDHLQRLAAGLAELSGRDGGEQLDPDAVLDELKSSVSGIEVAYDAYVANLNALLGALGISNSALARSLAFDPSYISRVLAGQRRPSDIPDFTRRVAQFIAMRHTEDDELGKIASVTGLDAEALAEQSSCASAIAQWLTRNPGPTEGAVDRFLRKLDEFDLDEYIRAIRFDELKVPTAPFQMPTTKTYEGIDQFKEAEFDFLKATVLSRSKEPVTMYSDMPLEQMSEDTDFAKKWMMGMAMLLKKGLHLDMIHDVNRPAGEMMLGLESWIPMYMTGQIAPYYLKASQSPVFTHLLKVSGTVAMAGEAIAGFHAHGRYVVTKGKSEVRYYRRRASDLLRRAYPLMRIFTEGNADEFGEFLRTIAPEGDTMRSILTSPPIYTADEELLLKILNRSDVPAKQKKAILEFARRFRESIERMLTGGADGVGAGGELLIELPDLGVEEFERHPMALSLSGAMHPSDVFYTYDEYRTHVAQTMAFAEEHAGCTVRLSPSTVFRNIQIHLLGNERVVVSKGRAPVIHFVIEHPNLVAAFRDFVPPLNETSA